MPDTIGIRADKGQGRRNHGGTSSGVDVDLSRDDWGFQNPSMFGNLNIKNRPAFDKRDMTFVVGQKLICYDIRIKRSLPILEPHAIALWHVPHYARPLGV